MVNNSLIARNNGTYRCGFALLTAPGIFFAGNESRGVLLLMRGTDVSSMISTEDERSNDECEARNANDSLLGRQVTSHAFSVLGLPVQ